MMRRDSGCSRGDANLLMNRGDVTEAEPMMTQLPALSPHNKRFDMKLREKSAK